MIIGHRGASGYAPENTLSSIKKAFELNAAGIEIDVQMSLDNQMFLFHDWTLDRIAGKSLYPALMKYSDIEKIDAGSWFSEKYTGEKIPLLEEVFSAVPAGKIVNIEIKKRADDERKIEEKLVEAVNSLNLKDQVIFSSFNHKSIMEINRIDCSIKTALIIAEVMADPLVYFEKFKCYSIHPAAFSIDTRLIRLVHEAGMKIIPWTVNAAEIARLLLDAGCDYVISDYPDLI